MGIRRNFSRGKRRNFAYPIQIADDANGRSQKALPFLPH